MMLVALDTTPVCVAPVQKWCSPTGPQRLCCKVRSRQQVQGCPCNASLQ